jgi:hypothetical protein
MGIKVQRVCRLKSCAYLTWGFDGRVIVIIIWLSGSLIKNLSPKCLNEVYST